MFQEHTSTAIVATENAATLSTMAIIQYLKQMVVTRQSLMMIGKNYPILCPPEKQYFKQVDTKQILLGQQSFVQCADIYYHLHADQQSHQCDHLMI